MKAEAVADAEATVVEAVVADAEVTAAEVVAGAVAMAVEAVVAAEVMAAVGATGRFRFLTLSSSYLRGGGLRSPPRFPSRKLLLPRFRNPKISLGDGFALLFRARKLLWFSCHNLAAGIFELLESRAEKTLRDERGDIKF